jgi:hypothetical protein
MITPTSAERYQAKQNRAEQTSKTVQIKRRAGPAASPKNLCRMPGQSKRSTRASQNYFFFDFLAFFAFFAFFAFLAIASSFELMD